MEYFYFHNFIYESVWQNNIRRQQERISLFDILHKYKAPTTASYLSAMRRCRRMKSCSREVVRSIGTKRRVKFWLRRVLATFDKVAWLNPTPQKDWSWTSSIGYVEQMMAGHMYPLTLKGLEDAMGFLARG